MTRDEVIELATKAGGSHFAKYSADVFVRFAELVAGHEREWVGLTKEEAADCWSIEAVKTWHAIETKLKEKNT